MGGNRASSRTPGSAVEAPRRPLRHFLGARVPATVRRRPVTEATAVNKPKASARRLGDLLERCLSQTLNRRGFTSTELLTRWPEIAGTDIAAHAEPLKISWPRGPHADAGEPATLQLRVEGPTALEIQHLSGVILERVNRFFGWRAVGKIVLRQAPLTRRPRPVPAAAPSPEATARIAATLTEIADEDLRQALARLGAAIGTTRPPTQ